MGRSIHFLEFSAYFSGTNNFVYSQLRYQTLFTDEGWTWRTCAADETCARWCIKRYMQDIGIICETFHGIATMDMKCHDYGRMFRGGLVGCALTSTCEYEQLIRATCYESGTDAGPPRTSSLYDC